MVADEPGRADDSGGRVPTPPARWAGCRSPAAATGGRPGCGSLASRVWPRPVTPPPITTRPGLKKLTSPAMTWPTRLPPSRIRSSAVASPGGGRGGDVDGGERAVRLQPGRELRPNGPCRAASSASRASAAPLKWASRQPRVAAGAGAAVGLDLDVADVAGAARHTAVDLAADDDAAADAGADLDAEEVAHGAGDARVLLPHRHQVHVVVDHDGAAEFLAERLADREAVPAGHDRRRDRHALGEADRTRYADAGAVEALGEPGGPAAWPPWTAPARRPRPGPRVRPWAG